MKYNEFTEDLLRALLGSGWNDLKALYPVVALAEKFGISTDDIASYVKDNVKDIGTDYSFNSVMYATMRLILDAIADKVDDADISDKIRETVIYINYLDSYFNIETLDSLSSKGITRMKTDTIIKNVIKDIKNATNY